jgi:hypothetical protein
MAETFAIAVVAVEFVMRSKLFSPEFQIDPASGKSFEDVGPCGCQRENFGPRGEIFADRN